MLSLSYKRQWLVRWGLVVMPWFHFSCAGLREISQTRPIVYDRPRSVESFGRPLPTLAKSRSEKPEYFVKKSDVEIIEQKPNRAAGSLFDLDDDRNRFFISGFIPKIGRYLEVKIDSPNLVAPKDVSKKGKDKKADEYSDPQIQALLDSLPNLTPPEGGEPRFISNIKMKVVDRFKNGDLLLTFQRNSQSERDRHFITIEATVPYHTVMSGGAIKVSDLVNISFIETRGQDVVHRQSSSWEDEYTARLSGYTEARSKVALELEDKRRDIERVRNKLDTRLRSFGKERRKVAQERDALLVDQKKDRAKLSKLSQKVQDQKNKIDEQSKIIKDLSDPSEKAGDDIDGADGE